MSKFFGPAHLTLEGEERVDTPVGVPCIMCDQPIAEGDVGSVMGNGAAMHQECGLRSVAGSVGHQLGLCSCYGGTEEDPEGLTPRQAAQAAMRVFRWKDEYKLSPIARPPIRATFRFVARNGNMGILCTRCGMTSHNPNDIAYLFCGNCRTFHTPEGK